jgi:hypothetical protein
VLIGEGRVTNLFTIFRALIDDFTVLGAWVALLLVGAAAGYAHRRLTRGVGSALAILAPFYAVVLWSPIVNIFIYNTVTVGWVVFVGVVLLVHSHIEHAASFGVAEA